MTVYKPGHEAPDYQTLLREVRKLRMIIRQMREIIADVEKEMISASTGFEAMRHTLNTLLKE